MGVARRLKQFMVRFTTLARRVLLVLMALALAVVAPAQTALAAPGDYAWTKMGGWTPIMAVSIRLV